MNTELKAGQKIVFIGDSITDAGRTGGGGEYGDGYASRVRELLLARHPERHLIVVNRGVSGDTVRHLAQRWERDVLAERPDWLSVKIGVNDVWRSFSGQPDEAVPADEYAATLRELLGRAADSGSKMVLIAPFLVESDRADPMRVTVEQYAAIVSQLAGEFGAPLVNLQSAFDAACEVTPPQMWAHDRVHPTPVGHTLIALEWLRNMGISL
ncbi:SGNH/GDSL hydrolase family protein [Deinococcus sp. AJ005]|uniref:SGNH/GDSL hydrolase family protein n=1 Tax=Deinococcus sp. AJ005 TaxID=2652443 RepID=UPI00125CC548|nr:SGNH/GDSL hydrolase family protein [Deinococcus sp. AJ005]QFP77027.1 SGNH/GDSL hydrolase family protein [Deinococcus sp. AJ005]